ncbi:putative manganese transporter [Clostridium sp. CCUG 7971]|uniref:putative manganese transporter n=1 Tax=Clostridium sp. CCUG 7971 TaxID=2811414 RepID=UPI001ABBD651|nr:putative manganese transporter [Clostridium sp. CCUG 7971]MBO3445312.1 arsenic efflux protein [Clostridium sp. CCUG 7971]
MEIFMSSAEEAFLHVGSMIGFFIVLFGYINYKTNENFTYIITKNKKLQPLIGALIGAIPGCGGSLAIIPLYIQGKLSFGAIVASLIASMGDAAFILISANFKVYLIVTIVGLITGILTGYIVDIFNLEIKLNLRKKQVSPLTRGTSCACNHGLSNNRENVKNQNSKIYKFAYLMTHKVGYKIYLLILLVGFAFMTIAHSGIENEIIHSIHELEEVLAVLGILSSIIYTMCFKVVSNNYNIDKDDRSSLKNILINGVAEISFIITWIFIAYLGYDFVVMLVGGEEYIANLVLYTGIGSVFIGALLGLIPGCGVQILLMSFYLKGNLPLGAVIANSISQDGDALFPIIALDKKSALWASIITTIPAILVGIIVYIITV